jgi:hypothetical protein
LTFTQDKVKGGLWFRVVDLIVRLYLVSIFTSAILTWSAVFEQSTRGVIWEHELPLEIEYNQDRGFFHSFFGDVSIDLSDVYWTFCLLTANFSGFTNRFRLLLRSGSQ